MTTAERKVRERYPDAYHHRTRALRVGGFFFLPFSLIKAMGIFVGSGTDESSAWTDAASRLPNDLGHSP